MKRALVLVILSLFLASCSHIPKPGNPFKKEEKKEDIVVIGGIKYKRVPIKDEKGELKGYRYVRVGGAAQGRTAPPSTVARTEPPKPIGVPYYKRHGTIFREETPKPVKKSTAPEKPLLRSYGVRKKVVFLSFEDYTGDRRESWGRIVPQAIEDILERTGKVRAVDEEEVFSVLGVRSKEKLLSPDNLMRIGEVFSAQAVVDGEVLGVYTSKYRETSFENPPTSVALAVINVRIYDTLSGSLIKSFTVKNSFFMTEEKGRFSEEKAKLKAVELVAKKASSKIAEELAAIPWWSRVIEVKNGEIFINSGRLTGVNIGDVFVVRSLGERVFDKLTKRVVGRVVGSEKARIKVVGYVGSDKAVCKLVQGGGVSVNDIITK